MLEMQMGACMTLTAASAQTYLRVCEAGCRYSVVVQHVLTSTHVLNSTDALCTGSMRQHVLACTQAAQAHVRTVKMQLQSFYNRLQCKTSLPDKRSVAMLCDCLEQTWLDLRARMSYNFCRHASHSHCSHVQSRWKVAGVPLASPIQ